MTAAPSLTVQDVTSVAGSTSTNAGNVSDTSADVTITTSPSGGTIRIVKQSGHLYVSGENAAVAGLFGIAPSAVAPAGITWIQLTKTDAPYSAIAASLNPIGLVQPFLATPATETSLLATAQTPASTVLSGPWSGSGPSNGWSGLTTLRIDPTTSLPRSGLIEFHRRGVIATRAAVFATWTSPISVTVPTVTTPFASLAR